MCLLSLPTEILDLIIDFILPETWSNDLHDPPWLKIRLVCGRLDAMLSLQAFKKYDFNNFDIEQLRPGRMTWLLSQVLLREWESHGNCSVLVERLIYDIGTRTRSNDTRTLQFKLNCLDFAYIRSACELAVSHQGPRNAIGPPIIIAVNRKAEKMVQLLLQYNRLNPNLKKRLSDKNAVYLASHAGYTAIVRLLLNHKHIKLKAHAKDPPSPLEAALFGVDCF